MRCRAAITQQPQLANLPCVIWPWPMRVVGVIDRRVLTGEPAVTILEWSSADVDHTEAFQWYVGCEPRSARTLLDLVIMRESSHLESLRPTPPSLYDERYHRTIW